MTVYHYLLALDEAGYLKPLIRRGVISSHLVQWMDIYAYHLGHSSLSHVQIALQKDTGKSTVQRALAFMNQPMD